MKNIIAGIMVALFISPALGGCEKQVKDGPVVPLRINQRDVFVDDVDTLGQIQITSGNGGYYIIYPKYIYISRDVYTDGSLEKVDYSESSLHLHIDNDNNIVVERRLINNKYVSGSFLVGDAKGEKRLFVVSQANVASGNFLSEEDWMEMEQGVLNRPDLWQGL